VLVFPENRFAVLTDERAMPRLKAAVGVGWTAFLTTDDSGAFRAMASELGPGVRCVQLYRDYLDNFRINRERE
jgi:adenine-specific DNA-methyltransferase